MRGRRGAVLQERFGQSGRRVEDGGLDEVDSLGVVQADGGCVRHPVESEKVVCELDDVGRVGRESGEVVGFEQCTGRGFPYTMLCPDW
jgi:hypothetical protein